MAKDQDDDKLSGDTLDNLEQVKKGKPRKFVMICKGTSVISLVVYKKGSVDKFKKEAKEAGKGQIYAGVIDGRGIDIHFKLSSEEYGKNPPVKSMVLKTFLEEKADIKCKPLIEMLDVVGLVLDEDDPEVQRFLKLQETALQAREAHADRADEINELCLAIGGHFDVGDRDVAIAKLDQLATLLSGLSLPTTPTETLDSPTTPETPGGDGTEAGKLEALLKRVRPEVEVLVKSGADTGGHAAALAKVDDLKNKSDFAAALAAAEELLKKLGENWTQRLEVVSPRVEKLLSGSFAERAGDIEKIKTVFGFAQERADTERFGSALVALKNVEMLLKAAEAGGAPKESDVIKEGTVAARKKFVESRWQSVIGKMHLEVDKLRPAIAMQNPDEEDPDSLPDEINAYLDDFTDELNDAILGVRKADDEDRGPIEEALGVIRDYRSRISKDEMLRHLSDASTELGTDVNVADALIEGLDAIEAQLV